MFSLRSNGAWTLTAPLEYFPGAHRNSARLREIEVESNAKTVHSRGCIESNPFQQGWFVPQDIDGLKTLMGGRGL